MLEAFAAALLLGGINTIADTVSAELKLAARPIYVFARVLVMCYCVGGIVGARAKQLMMGTVGGLMIGSLVAAVYYLLAPVAAFAGLALARTLVWVGFSLLEALLEGGSSIGGAALQGVLAAILAGGFYYAISGIWPEMSSREPDLLRALLSWSAAFLPGFIVLFWKK